MVSPITDWRIARSFIGAGSVSTIESVELDFNIGAQEAIEISGVTGIINPFSVASAATIVPIVMQQSLHIEDGTIETLSVDPTDADQFDNDSEVIFEQKTGLIAWDGTTEGGAALSSVNLAVTYPRPRHAGVDPVSVREAQRDRADRPVRQAEALDAKRNH
jgi:hypothetical protein